MESSGSLKILINTLRSELTKSLSELSSENGKPWPDVDETVASLLEAVNIKVLSGFELVSKTDYESQISLIHSLSAQLGELEDRLEKLEQKS